MKLLRLFEKEISSLNLQIERLSRKDIHNVANIFQEKFNPDKEIPVPIDLIAERDLGIHIIPMHGLREKLENDGFISSDFTTIHVDLYVYNSIEVRYRFSIAHEIGHYWLHKDIFKELYFDNIKSWKEVYKSIDDDDYQWLEFQANNFAGFVLIPDFSLKSPFNESLNLIKPKIDAVKKNGIAREDYIEHVISLLAIRLSPIFNVSTASMEYRIKNDPQYKSLIP